MKDIYSVVGFKNIKVQSDIAEQQIQEKLRKE